jgi:hypothetical protein
LSDALKVAHVEAAKEMSRVLQESETNNFATIATGDEYWFQHTTESLTMFARSAAYVISRTRQAVGAKKTMAAVFFTAKKFILFTVLPRGRTFNRPYFMNSTFPDLKTANVNFRHHKTRSTFWLHWMIPYAIPDRMLAQTLRRTRFSECPTGPLYMI